MTKFSHTGEQPQICLCFQPTEMSETYTSSQVGSYAPPVWSADTSVITPRLSLVWDSPPPWTARVIYRCVTGSCADARGAAFLLRQVESHNAQANFSFACSGWHVSCQKICTVGRTIWRWFDFSACGVVCWCTCRIYPQTQKASCMCVICVCDQPTPRAPGASPV